MKDTSLASADQRFRDLGQRLRTQPMDANDVGLAATLVLSASPARASRWLFRLLRREPLELLVGNVVRLFAELSGRDARWTTLIRKSTGKRGRCPHPLKRRVAFLVRKGGNIAEEAASLTEVLSSLTQAVSELPESEQRLDHVVIRPQFSFFSRSTNHVIIKLNRDLTDIRHMDVLSDLLGNVNERDSLTLDCSEVEHAYITGMAAIVAICRQLRIIPRVINASENVDRYLDRMNFFRALQGVKPPQMEIDPRFAVAIEEVTPETTPEDVAGKIVSVIAAWQESEFPLAAEERSSLIVLLSELIENINRHAGPYTSAFTCAQVFPKKRKLSLCLVDTGMGIRRSFLQGKNPDARRRIQSGEPALQLACRPLVTSKPQAHSGYGLYLAGELITRNGGTFRIYSDGELYSRFLRRWQRRDFRQRAKTPWQGTWISIIIDLQQRLSALDVYKTLPTPAGVMMEDFFA